MYRRPLLPRGVRAPLRLEADGFVLRPLTVHDVVRDFDAVMSSADRLRGHMDPDDPWPDGLTLEENLVDLGWHQRETTSGHSFAFTVVTPDEARCLGCTYLYPSDKAGFDAMAFWWVRSSEVASDLDGRLGAVFRTWLRQDWPPLRIAFPGRDQAWPAWQALPDAR